MSDNNQAPDFRETVSCSVSLSLQCQQLVSAFQNTEEGFVDDMMKNGPHRLMNMIADYAARGPSGRAI
jgi:hypothetical protein